MDRNYPNIDTTPFDGDYNIESTDILRGRFTKWLEVLIYRAKLKYLRKLSQQIETVSLDELIDNGFQAEDPSQTDLTAQTEQHTFAFEEERLAKAFLNLPLKRRQILEMLFIEQMTSEEIAKKLGCSVQYVYNQRSTSLKKLRLAIMEETEHEE